PNIMNLDSVGIIAWVLGAHPGYTWLIEFTVILLYYIKRYLDKREIVKKIYDYFPTTARIATSPTINLIYSTPAITTSDIFYADNVDNGHILIIDEFEKVSLPDSKMIEVATQDKNIAAFLSFSPVYRWETTKYDDFTEIRFIDLRYRSKDYYPFV